MVNGRSARFLSISSYSFLSLLTATRDMRSTAEEPIKWLAILYDSGCSE